MLGLKASGVGWRGLHQIPKVDFNIWQCTREITIGDSGIEISIWVAQFPALSDASKHISRHRFFLFLASKTLFYCSATLNHVNWRNWIRFMSTENSFSGLAAGSKHAIDVWPALKSQKRTQFPIYRTRSISEVFFLDHSLINALSRFSRGTEIVSRLWLHWDDSVRITLETHLVTEQWIFQFHACVEVNLKFKVEEFESFVTQFHCIHLFVFWGLRQSLSNES